MEININLDILRPTGASAQTYNADVLIECLSKEISDMIDDLPSWADNAEKLIRFKNSAVGKMIAEFCATQNPKLLVQIEELISTDNPWGVYINTQEIIDDYVKNTKHEIYCITKPHFHIEELYRFYLFDTFDIDEDIRKVSGVETMRYASLRCVEKLLNSIGDTTSSLDDVMCHLYKIADILDINIDDVVYGIDEFNFYE